MFFLILQQGVIVPAGQGEEGGDNITLLLFPSNLGFYLIKTSSQLLSILLDFQNPIVIQHQVRHFCWCLTEI